MMRRQLELSFTNQPGVRRRLRGRGRASRANWWFERMRGVVSDARERPPPPPELGGRRWEEADDPAGRTSRE